MAGFLDGEGCFQWKRGVQPYQGTARVDISNTYLPILRVFKRRFGGNYYRHKAATGNRRTCWAWYVTGPGARSLIRAVLPYLIEKQEQARLLLLAGEQLPLARLELLARIAALKHTDCSEDVE